MQNWEGQENEIRSINHSNHKLNDSIFKNFKQLTVKLVK